MYEEALALLPVAFWPLNEQSGDYIDATGGGYDGALTLGAGSRAGTTIWDGGGYALDLDGSATFAAVTHDAALAANAFTVWAFFNADAKAGTLVNKGRADLTQYYQLGFSGAGLLIFDISTSVTGFSRVSIAAAAFDTGTNYLAAATYTSGTQTLSITNLNTGAVTTATPGTPTGTMVISTNNLGIGANFQAAGSGSPTGFFNGRIGGAGYHNAVLTAAQIAALASRAHAVWTRTNHRRLQYAQ